MIEFNAQQPALVDVTRSRRVGTAQRRAGLVRGYGRLRWGGADGQDTKRRLPDRMLTLKATRLAINDPDYPTTRIRPRHTNACAEPFRGTALEAFTRIVFHQRFHEFVQPPPSDLNASLREADTHGPHPGYHSQGRNPSKTL